MAQRSASIWAGCGHAREGGQGEGKQANAIPTHVNSDCRLKKRSTVRHEEDEKCYFSEHAKKRPGAASIGLREFIYFLASIIPNDL
jgi:hypothetical protein